MGGPGFNSTWPESKIKNKAEPKSNLGLVKAHRMIRRKAQRHSGTDPHSQECKLVQEHQQER